MSLKAKIEAVIYAAEEPVTLAQLSFLFGGEVLEAAALKSAGESEPDAAPAGSAVISEEALEVADAGAFVESGGLWASKQEEGVASGDASELSAAVGTAPDMEAATAVLPEGAAAAGAGLATAEAENPEAGEKKAARLRERTIREGLTSLIAELMAEYGDRGMEIREIAGGYRVATKPEYHDAVRAFIKSLKPAMKLSKQALETLAVIAYKQPVTAPEVSEIRGADSGGVLGNLMSRKLITTAGRKQVIGRPILYKTTKEFLLRFGLMDLSELPTLDEFQKMAAEVEMEDEGAEVSPTAELLFEANGNGGWGEGWQGHRGLAEAEDSDAIEANAGEAGVAVSIPADSLAAGVAPAVAEGAAPEMVALDSHLAEQVDPAGEHAAELMTAVHPTTVPGDEE